MCIAATPRNRAAQWSEIKSRLTLPLHTNDACTEEHHAAVYRFFSAADARLLFAWVADGQLALSPTLPGLDAEALTFFIRDAPLYYGDAFEAKVQYGTVQRDLVASLYHLMDDIYSPLLVRNPQWPESVRNEFSTGMNRLLSVLTDENNRGKGFTVLYVPNEDLSAPLAELAQSKELVQRLEATVIHWTRQIKDVLNSTNQETSSRPNELPLDELDYWCQRVEDLSGISQQLDKPGVGKIEKVLAAAKSTYLLHFTALATQIKEGMSEAQSNSKFLATLKEPCLGLAKAELARIPDLLPNILDLTRLIWIHSPFYNTRERVTVLLQKVLPRICLRSTSSWPR